MKTPILQPIRYDARQVALMVQIVLLYSKDSLMNNTGHNLGTLRSIAAQKRPPTVVVLRYLRLTADGDEYVWDPALDYKIPCWGPIVTTPSEEVIQIGAAIHHAVRTVESGFVDR